MTAPAPATGPYLDGYQAALLRPSEDLILTGIAMNQNFWRGFKPANRHVALLGRETPAGFYKLKGTLDTPGCLAGLLNQYEWAVPVKEFAALPHHYYPCPHNFATSGNGFEERLAKVKATGEVGAILFGSETNDHQVRLDFSPQLTWEQQRTDKTERDCRCFRPEELEDAGTRPSL